MRSILPGLLTDPGCRLIGCRKPARGLCLVSHITIIIAQSLAGNKAIRPGLGTGRTIRAHGHQPLVGPCLPWIEHPDAPDGTGIDAAHRRHAGDAHWKGTSVPRTRCLNVATIGTNVLTSSFPMFAPSSKCSQHLREGHRQDVANPGI